MRSRACFVVRRAVDLDRVRLAVLAGVMVAGVALPVHAQPAPPVPVPVPAGDAPTPTDDDPADTSAPVPMTTVTPDTVEHVPIADRESILENQPAASGMSMSEDITMLAGSARSNASNWILMERGYELGVVLRYLTSEGGLGDEGLDFTDVIVLDLQGRKAFGGKAEIYGGVALLPKQPSFTDEMIWQGATVGGRLRLQPWLAGEARVAGGPLLGDQGYWGSAALGVTARKIVDETLAFQGMAAASATPFAFDDDRDRFWLAEAEVRGDIQVHAPNGVAGMWVGFGFAFPVGHAGDYPGMGAFDPQTRGDFHLGGVYALVERWDLFVEYAILDRGDLADPRTTVPVLDGGFDQRQLVFGVTRRFDTVRHDDVAMLAW